MDSRELVQLAKALTGYDNVSVESIELSVEHTDKEVRHGRTYTVTSNGDLFRPFHIGELGFDDADDVLAYVTQ